MSRTQRREREKQELRQQIVDAARRLLAAQGREAVTVRKIAEAIEYSPTTIYLYFEDKDALIRELCRVDASPFIGRLESLAHIDDPLETLRQTALAYVEFGVTHPNHYTLMFRTPACTTGETVLAATTPPEQNVYAHLERAVGACVMRGLFRDELGDVGEIAQLLWASLHGLVSLHLAKGNETWVDWRPSRHLAERLIDLQLRGLLREPGLCALFHVA